MAVITIKPRKYDKNPKRENDADDLETIAEHLHSAEDIFTLRNGKQYSIDRAYVNSIKYVYLPIISVLLLALLAYMQLSPKEGLFAWVTALIYIALIAPIKRWLASRAPLLWRLDLNSVKRQTAEKTSNDEDISAPIAIKAPRNLTADRDFMRWAIYVIANTALFAFLWHISIPPIKDGDTFTKAFFDPSYSFYAIPIFIAQYPLMVKYSRLWECAIVYPIVAIVGALIVSFVALFPFGPLLAFILLQTLIVPALLPLMIAFNLLWAQWLLIKREGEERKTDNNDRAF
ncbi:MAG: hypothetical protein LBO72_09300 [Helicobacteraceae bacterium]|jgi:hypothetical protein|nr:hypothetical protein [Helicobacteraceae bacterium]